MSVYSAGGANVIVGSSNITGNGTRWDLYVQNGYLFKLTSEAPIYTIADVVSSAQITLTSRYADSNNETSHVSEHLATVNHSSTQYSGTTDNTPIIRSSVTVNASVARWTDNGAGVLATTAGAGLGIAGTVSYDDGSWQVSINATDSVATNVTITATYNNGDTLNAMPYQIVKDFTTYYSFPEISLNDSNFAHLYTKAINMVDTKMYTASVNTLSVDAGQYIRLGTKQYIFFGAETAEATIVAVATYVNASIKGSMYMSTAGELWMYDGDTTATKVSLT